MKFANWISLSALILSIINFGILIYSHRLCVVANNIKVIPLNKADMFFIECILSNPTSLPFSVYDVQIACGEYLLENRKEDLFVFPLKEQPQIQRIQVATDIPILIDAYTSRRIVLEFDLSPQQNNLLKTLLDNKRGKPYDSSHVSRQT